MTPDPVKVAALAEALGLRRGYVDSIGRFVEDRIGTYAVYGEAAAIIAALAPAGASAEAIALDIARKSVDWRP